MNRRNALKGLGLSLGYVVATPTVLGILQSCKNDTSGLWTPEFFSVDEGIVLKNLVDLILPKTDNLPGANDVNVPQFIDAYVAEVAKKEDQNNFKNGIKTVIKTLGKDVDDVTIEDYDSLLSKFLKADKDAIEKFKTNPDDAAVYETLNGLRDISIWGYRTSEKIGKEVLAYDPVPGKLEGCISLEEATGGKSWSLRF